MVHSGTAKTDNNAASIIVGFIKGNEALEKAARDFLKKLNIDELEIINKSLQNMKDVKAILKVLGNENGIAFLETIVDNLSYDQSKNMFVRAFGQNPNMAQKADTLGKNIAIGVGSGILGGAISVAIGANLGAISAGLGVAGAGIAAFAPFIAIGAAVIVAIALIALAIYHRKAISENIKGGAKHVGEKVEGIGEGIGEGVMHLLKNLFDKLPLRSSNIENYLEPFYAPQITKNAERMQKGNPLPDDAAFVTQYLLNEDGFKALNILIAAGEDKKITVKDKDNKDVILKLEDLTRLKEKGDSTYTEADDAKFRIELKKFELIMSETNKGIRKQVEAEQDKIHKKQYSGKPAPSSALYPGSIANTELLKQVDDGKRKDVKDLLEKVAELKETGTTAGFRTDLYKQLTEYEDYKIDISKLEGNGSTELTELAATLNKLEHKQIKELSEKVDVLKKGQNKGPNREIGEVRKPEQHVGQSQETPL